MTWMTQEKITIFRWCFPSACFSINKILERPIITSSSELLNPELPEKLDRVRIPVVEATDESLKGFGCLVEKQEDQEIEIVRWPHQGWREVDPDTGNEGGTTEGIFEGEWKGDVL